MFLKLKSEFYFNILSLLHIEYINTWMFLYRGNSMSLNDANNVNCPRSGESAEQVKFRSQRLFSVGPQWFFSTREGTDQGPFSNKEQAQQAINTYIQEVTSSY